MREEKVRVGKKRICIGMAMLLISMFLVIIGTSTVHAETYNCEVYYDAVREAVQLGNKEAGKEYQLDADLCEIAKQIAVNGASELPGYLFTDPDWIEEMLEKTGNLKSCKSWVSGYSYHEDTTIVQEDIVRNMDDIEEWYPDYNLIGAAVICNDRNPNESRATYTYAVVIGKGEVKPET